MTLISLPVALRFCCRHPSFRLFVLLTNRFEGEEETE
jgi:hypothetical protein